MKKFTRYNISVGSEEEKDLVIAFLSDWGIEAFEEKEDSLIGSGETGAVNEARVEDFLDANRYAFVKDIVENENWNAAWEASFEPVLAGDFVGIRAAFHAPIQNVEHEVIITPKMSFGTGHHATTWLMINMMRHLDFTDKQVLDFGTGTGVLAILADKLGSKMVLAIDNDEWSINNALENVSNNHCEHIEVRLLDQPPAHSSFDIVLANINKHILLEYMPLVARVSVANGTVVLSGLLTADESDIVHSAASNGLKFCEKMEKDGWIALKFTKHKS